MTIIDERPDAMAIKPPVVPVVPVVQPPEPPPPALQQWGNSAPLALAGFAMTTFLLSMINAGFVDKGIEPVVFGMAATVGGGAQFIAGLIQLRSGKTFAGVLFSGFGAFWLSFWVITQFYVADVPKAQVGHALGMYILAWAAFIVWLWFASFRTNLVVSAALLDLIVVFIVLGIGYYADIHALVTTSGYLGLAAAGAAAYLSCAELCEEAYGRDVLPVGSLAKH